VTILVIGNSVPREGEDDPRTIIIHPGSYHEATEAIKGTPEANRIIRSNVWERITEIRILLPNASIKATSE